MSDRANRLGLEPGSVPTRTIRRVEARAVTILLKARELAGDINDVFGFESTASDAAEETVTGAERLAGWLERLPEVLKAGGQA